MSTSPWSNADHRARSTALPTTRTGELDTAKVYELGGRKTPTATFA